MKALPDAYDARARIAPLVLVLLPVVSLLLGSALNGSRSAFGGSLVLVAVTTFLAQAGRDRGKQLEPELWAEWGGSPTTQLLRTGPSTATARRRASVEDALNLKLPTAEEQRTNPGAADERLGDAIAQLRARATRDAAPLVWQENVNYGFRRNLLGLRRLGLAVAVGILAVTAVATALTGHPADRLLAFALPAATAVAELAVLLLVVNPPWVRVPADAYATRLLDEVPQYATPPRTET